MKKGFLIILGLAFTPTFSQTITQKLEQSTKELLASPEMISANMSFFVSDEKGNVIFDYQGNKGLSTASTQKVFTAITALELLGKDFRYTTKMLYNGEITQNILKGDLILTSNGDPTLGSWRYEETKPEPLKQKIVSAVKSLGIKEIKGNIIIDDSHYDFQTIPGGWAWNDIGNYYGAGIWGVNWRENQFDVYIEGENKQGENTKIKNFSYPLENIRWVNETTTYQGTRDKSIIYTAPHSGVAYINGQLPMGKITKISGAVPNPPLQLGVEIYKRLKESNIIFEGEIITASQELIEKGDFVQSHGKEIWVHYSPKMEEIVYWFMKKSVNLYGEAIIKTLGKEKNNNADFSNGIKIMKDFWQSKGIHPAMINFIDGSGLSPQNYASAKAEVQALVWAKNQSWYPVFDKSLPIYNGMKMKSGTIKDAKAYAGYHTSKEGKKYVFAVIINNYHGSNVNDKLFKLLNTLK